MSCSQFSLTKLLTLGTIFSTDVRVLVLAMLLIVGISHLTSLILALREALVTKLVISGILSSIFFYLCIIRIFKARDNKALIKPWLTKLGANFDAKI